MVKRTTLLAAVLAALIVAMGGVASALTFVEGPPIRGTKGADDLRGTSYYERIYGLQGRDTIEARGGGPDRVLAGRGDDTVNAADDLPESFDNLPSGSEDSYRDYVRCGAGADTAYVDLLDTVHSSCETVEVEG